MKDTTRKHVRATLAAVCALSLAASLAFPLAAMAQTGEPLPDLAVTDADVVEDDNQLLKSEPAEKDAPENPASIEAAPSIPVDSNAESGKAETVGDNSAIASPSAEAADMAELPVERTLSEPVRETDAGNAAAAPSTTEAPKEATEETATEIPADQYVDVFFVLCPPREFEEIESNARLYCSIPLGMSFQEAKQKGVLKEGSSERSKDYFFNLGTENPVGIGDAHPEIQGYTFGGWMTPQEHTVIDETTPISQREDGLYILTGSWKKDGSNVVSSTKTLLGGLYVVAEGNLSGENIPAGADIRAVSVPNPVFIESDFITEAEKDIVDTDTLCSVNVDLFVNGKQVHDKFGSLKLTFYNDDGFSEDATVRVWHRHLDGSVSHEDVKPAGNTVSVTVTDLSRFLYAELTKDPIVIQPEQKPGTEGGNQGTQQPGGNNDGNGDKKDEDNKNDNGGDKKTDDGKKTSSGDKGNNANKNTGGLAKTGDEMRYALGGTMAALTVALFTGGIALLMGNRKRPAHRRR